MLKFFGNLIGIIRHPSSVLVILAGLLLVAHLRYAPNLFEPLRAETLHDFSLSMTFDPQESQVSVETFLPITNEHQEIIRESVLSGQLQFDDQSSDAGRNGLWTGEGASEIRYRALISTRRVVFELDESLQIAESHPEKLQPYLIAAEGIQLGHPEIEEAWVSIQPDSGRELVPVLRSIYDFTYEEIESAPFKGFTDALTALRLRQASCNGKGRLFVALARQNGIPARLVGGVILNNGTKKTSHQWIEVHIQDQWVPFDPTNGYFATLPENYLRLYTGDESLFTHTRNINFDYRFRISRNQISPALFRFADEVGNESTFNAARLLKLTGLTENMVGVFLMFPLATLITVFLRNIIGLKMFGIFMPMLVAAACVQTGLVLGLLTFSGVVAFSFLGQIWLSRFNLLKIPRLAAIITLCTVLFIVLLYAVGQNSTFEFGVLAMFPVVIISFLAERIHKMASDQDWRTITLSALGALVTIAICFTAFSSVTLQGVFALMPELLLVVLALQIALGQWSGMRLLEYVRFRDILGNGPVLGINQRNRKYINTLNSSELLELAADKLRSKEMLESSGIPIAPTLSVC
ncbi:MAG: 7TM domain-containing protein, partial [Hyphomonadaceae bacterium]